MQNFPLLTVITPVFNGEKYLKNTMESVLNFSKGYQIEYLVVNDGSTDNTISILQQFGDSIKVINQQNQGESAAVNTGIDHANGEFILVVSADDPLFTSNIFEGVKIFFDQYPETVVWYPDWQLIDRLGNITEVRILPDYEDRVMIGEFVCLPGPGTIFRKSAAQNIGGRDTNLIFTGDYDFWMRLSRIGRIVHRSGVLAQWRNHEDSTSISKRGVVMARERIHVIEKFIASNNLESDLRKSALAHAHYYAARLVIFDRKVNGKLYLIKALVIQKKWISKANPVVVAYIFLTPFSQLLLKIYKRYWNVNLRAQ
jgi:glycosyltransferase involved in cell wall biosynthesis